MQLRMKTSQYLFITLTALLQLCGAYKIMVLFPFLGRSHSILGYGIVRNLLEAGHEVTYVTAYPKAKPPKNLTQIDVSSVLGAMTGEADIKAIIDKEDSFNDQKLFFTIINNVTKSTLKHKEMQKIFYDQNIHFDAIIAEWLFSDLFSAVQTIYDCPFIWLSSCDPHWAAFMLIDEATNPAYVPNIVSEDLPPFTFVQRVRELLMQTIAYMFREFYFVRIEAALYEEIFAPILKARGKPLPPYLDVKFNTSLVLGNSHVSSGQSISLPQSFKPVGGYHVDPQVTTLPDDLQKLMDNAKYGVIYFSLGSNVKSKDLPDSIKKSLLQMFGGLKQTVLWKIEEVLENLPKNVHILQWAPQTSILSHPNCRVFITHGGMLSTIETVHFGVPIIGIPVFGDQFANLQRAVKSGFAIKVDISYDLSDKLKMALEEILSDNKYTERVKKLSWIYHDRPAAPGAELVHWVQHAVRTRGAAHLRSPALTTPLHQKMYLDLAALVLVILTVTYKLLKKGLQILCGSKKQTEASSNKKKNKKIL